MVSLKKPDKVFALLLLTFIVFELLVVHQIWDKPLVWDSAVYVAMGKNLYSMGQYGLWETFRPPLLPFIYGLLWLTGLLNVNSARILALVISALSLMSVYYIFSRLETRKTAFLTSFILMASSTFLLYSTYPLTGIISSALVLWVIFFLERDKEFFSGIALSVVFLLRFPGLIAASALIPEFKGLLYDKKERMAMKIAYFMGGFSLIVILYLISNFVTYSNPLEPIIGAITVPASAKQNYFFGLFFMKSMVESNLLLALTPLGIYFMVKDLKSRYLRYIGVFLSFYLVFTIFPHKEVRYSLMFLPLAALFSSRAVLELSERIDRENFMKAVYGILIIITAVSMASTYSSLNWESQERADFYSQTSNLTGEVFSNDPVTTVYGDFRYRALPPGYLQYVWDRHHPVDYIAINDCAWYCTSNESECMAERENLMRLIEENYRQYYQSSSRQCNYSIYSLR